MPKLPQLEYNVTVQGPPSTAQAFDSLARGAQALQDVQNDAMLEVAKEQAKSQATVAESLFHAGLGRLENDLQTKPYLTPNEVKATFEGNVPPEVQAELDKHVGREDQAVVSTPLVGGAMHAYASRRFAEEAGKEIWSRQVRDGFVDRAQASSVERRIRLEHGLAQALVQEQAAKEEVALDLAAKNAWRLDQQDELVAKLNASGVITPARKALIRGKWAEQWQADTLKRNAARLAEFALSTGRDGVTPWVDAATAKSNFETLAAKEKDPLVVEEARTRLNNALHQDALARDTADAPALGRLAVQIDSGRGLLQSSDDYRSLSDVGKAKATAHANAYLRSKRAEGTQERLIQNQIDQLADAYWKSLPATGAPGADKETIKIDRSNPYFKDASPKVLLTVTGHQNDVRTAVAKDRGVSLQEFEKEAKTIAEGMGWDLKAGGQGALFVDAMTVAWMKWKNNPENAGKPVPSDAEAYQMFRSALRYGEKAIDKSRRMPGFLQLQPNMYAWEANKDGTPFTAEGFSDQPGLALLEARRRELGKAISAATGPTPNDPTKPILLNPDGSWSTEKTMTFEVDGKHVVLPTIVGGKEVSGEEALKLFRAGKNAPVGSFDTAKEANDYAQKRHEEEQRLRADEAAFLLDFKATHPNEPLPKPAEVKQFLPAWKAEKAKKARAK